VQECERLLALDGKLNLYLAGKETPKKPQELVPLADLCRIYKGYHASAARLYAAAVAANPKLAEAASDRRHQFARSALLATSSQGSDPKPATAEEKTKFRNQALAWLKADLQQWARRFQDRDDKAFRSLMLDLPTWPAAPGLALVHARKELDKLPADEREAWQQWWADLDALLDGVAANVRTHLFKGALTTSERERVHELKMQAGQVYFIDLESAQFDAYLQVKDSGGKVLAQHDDISPHDPNARLIFTAPQTGTYRLVATSPRQLGTGVYMLTVRAFARAKSSPSVRSRAAALTCAASGSSGVGKEKSNSP
jgi:hypothetical protein